MSNQSKLLLVTSGPDQPVVLGIHKGFFSNSLSPSSFKSRLAHSVPMAAHSPGSALAPQSLTRKQELRDFTNSLPKHPISLHSCQVLEKVRKTNQVLTYMLVSSLAIYFPGGSTYGRAERPCRFSWLGGREGRIPHHWIFSLSLQSAALDHGLTLRTSREADPTKGAESS